MPTYTSVFTSQTPAGVDFTDGDAAIATGTTFRFTSPGWVYGHRFYSPLTISTGIFTASFWKVTNTDDPVPGTGTGTLLASKVYPSVSSSSWNTVLYDTPVAVLTGTGDKYRSVVHNSLGRYVSTSAFFVDSGLTNGDVVAVQTGSGYVGIGTMRNGTFDYSPTALTYPTNSFNGGCYFVDVLFSTEAPDTGAGNRMMLFFT